MLPPRITSPIDLVTPHEAVCAGFLRQALSKTEKAKAYVQQARRLRERLEGANDIPEVAHLTDVRLELLAAAGFSDKAMNHLSAPELESALTQVLATIQRESGQHWKAEVVDRYLLTKGDSLGGSMRNYTGASAATTLCHALVQALGARNITPEIQRSAANAEKIQVMRWSGRILLFDKTPQFLGNSVDLIMLKAPLGTEDQRQLVHDPTAFIACGELKGGIDPAGADEHWKTANSALQRIREKFEADTPALFFVGAAIEAAMAQEIFAQLSDGRLTYAANLTSDEQLGDLASWLVGL